MDAVLPPPGRYGVGNVFLPRDPTERAHCKRVVAEAVARAGQRLLRWRSLPIDPNGADIGDAARAAMPVMEQLFIAAAPGVEGDALERRLYLIRKDATHRLRSDTSLAERQLFYICSLSTKIVIYKGMLTPHQLFTFFPDLEDEDYESHLAMVHSRFSTNTFPSWDRAQPNRFMCHNGEINTLLGNKNWMNAREGVVRSDLFGDDLPKLFPVVEEDCSDSGTFDNVLEFLLMTGRTLQEAVLMMIPEAWQQHPNMPEARRAFYEYHSCLMEPWDGPASIAFTDGTYIGAVLDRNGLRPSRYYVTDDHKCIMASEVGVVTVDPERVVEKGRLQPGKIFLIDFDQGRMIPDEEIKTEWAAARPYKRWLDAQRIELTHLPAVSGAGFEPSTLMSRMQAFGYTAETMQFMLVPMVQELRDPLGSMGNDAALAVMSEKPRMLYDYFKQLFAQVTNPAIDSIREEVIMALDCYIGPERNLLEVKEGHAHRLRIPHPILSNEELATLKGMDHRGWRTKEIDITFPLDSGKSGLLEAFDRISIEASQAIEDGYSLIVLSDRAIGPERVPISALAAVGAVHHHLVREHARTRIGILVETGEAREVHHHCLLIGYGADAINPYLAFEALWDARRNGYLSGAAHVANDADIVTAYRKGRGQGHDESDGQDGHLDAPVLQGRADLRGRGTERRRGGALFRGHREPCARGGLRGPGGRDAAPPRHRVSAARHGRPPGPAQPGRFSLAPRRGHAHVGSGRRRRPATGRAGQQYRGLPALLRARQQREHAPQYAARDCCGSDPARGGDPVDVDEVEPAKEIVKRFATGAMSFGSISKEAHESLAVAMNRIGGKSNTGEGGEDSLRYTRCRTVTPSVPPSSRWQAAVSA